MRTTYQDLVYTPTTPQGVETLQHASHGTPLAARGGVEISSPERGRIGVNSVEVEPVYCSERRAGAQETKNSALQGYNNIKHVTQQ